MTIFTSYFLTNPIGKNLSPKILYIRAIKTIVFISSSDPNLGGIWDMWKDASIKMAGSVQ